MLAQQLLRVVGSVEGLTLGVVARAGVVATDDQMGAAEILADDRVPHGLAWAAHPHGQRQQRELDRVLRVVRQHFLVAVDPRVVVQVAGLGQAHHRVDQQVGLDFLGRTQGQLVMRAMHRVPRLEGHDAAPAQPGELLAHLGGRQAQFPEVVLGRQLDTFELASDVVRLRPGLQVTHRGVLGSRRLAVSSSTSSVIGIGHSVPSASRIFSQTDS